MKRVLLLTMLCALLVAEARAATEAGKAIFVRGSVTAERGEVVALARNDLIFEQDVVATGERSRAQFLMKDGAKYEMSPQTRFRVAEYRFAGETVEEPDGSIIVSSDDGVAAELIQGAFRTITGTIGRDDPQDYQVETPAATMGIRGTHYSAAWCLGNCLTAAGARIPDGLYVGVVEGIVYLVNNAGELLVRAGEYAYARDRDTAPVRLDSKPAALRDLFRWLPDDDGRAVDELLATLAEIGPTLGIASDPSRATPPSEFNARTGPDAGDASGAGAPPDGARAAGAPLDAPPLPSHDSEVLGEDEPERVPRSAGGDSFVGGTSPETRALTFASAPLATSAVFASATTRGARALDAGDDLTRFGAAFPGQSREAVYAIGSATVRDDGFDPLTGFRWGRWTGGVATAMLADGSTVGIDLGAQSLHYVLGPMPGSRPALPMGGTANFRLIAGNTDPTDNMGNTGVLGDASLLANFTTRTVTSDLVLSIDGQRWTANGTGPISQSLFSGDYTRVTIGGQAAGAGMFSGFFAAPGANGFPAGAGLSYGLTGPQGVSVSGAVVFGFGQPVTQ